MMIHGKALALCIVCLNALGGAAFVLQAPEALLKNGLAGRLSSSSPSDATSKTQLNFYINSYRSNGMLNGSGSDTAVFQSSSSNPSFPKPAASPSGAMDDMRKKFYDSASPGRQVSSGPGQKPTSNQSNLPVENPAKTILDTAAPIKVQGGSLKTWSYSSPMVKRVLVVMKTDGRPLEADIELWQGPDNTPHRMRVYVEDGNMRPFCAVIETPNSPNTVAVRNTAQMEFPLDAYMVADASDTGNFGSLAVSMTSDMNSSKTIQGGALRTYPFEPSVKSVQVLLKTDGRPLNARVELLQGPNNIKQVIELYAEDGKERPYYAILETPGSGNVVRVVNTATVEFPMTAWVEPYLVGNEQSDLEPVLGGDSDGLKLDPKW